jgi:hypothetical protein
MSVPAEFPGVDRGGRFAAATPAAVHPPAAEADTAAMGTPFTARCPGCWDRTFSRLPFTPASAWTLLFLCRPVRCNRCGQHLMRPLWCC